jgi:BMFP domain-containing protein YqiC
VQKDHKIFDDLSRFASGAAGSFLDMKREMEANFHSQVEKWLERMNLVTREEFDVVKAMAETARAENDILKARIDALEAKQK